MNLKDIEAAISDAVKASRKALTVLQQVQDTIDEADQQITLCKQLDEAGELQNILREHKLIAPKGK